MSDNNSNQSEPTLEELRALGSAEFSAMIFTPPGGSAMSLDEYAEHQKRESAEAEAGRRRMMQADEDEDRRRREMKNMTNEERAAYLARENKE